MAGLELAKQEKSRSCSVAHFTTTATTSTVSICLSHAPQILFWNFDKKGDFMTSCDFKETFFTPQVHLGAFTDPRDKCTSTKIYQELHGKCPKSEIMT